MKRVSQKNRFVDQFGGDQMHFRGWMETIPEHVGVWVRCDDASIQLLAGGCRRSQLAAQAVAGADGLCFLPYLSPAGERVPFLNTGARGSLFGLSFEHGREHLARAVLEGLSLVIRVVCRHHKSHLQRWTFAACAEKANGDVWCQLISDSRRDGPRHEQNPEEWWRAISAASREAIAALPAGLSICDALDSGHCGC